jgi:hypothetical protein
VPENSAAFWKEEFENSLFQFSFIKKWLLNGRAASV